MPYARLRKSLRGFGIVLFLAIPILQGGREIRAEKADYDVIIVGAGIAGLTAAVELARENKTDPRERASFLVLEKKARAGGRARSGRYAGFTYAMGTEYLGKPAGALKRLIKIVGVKPRMIPSPTDAHWREGKFHYGEDGLARLFIENSNLETYNRFMKTVQALAGPYEHPPDLSPRSRMLRLDRGSAEYLLFEKHHFPDFYRNYYDVASRGLFGAGLRHISALSLVPEIAFDFVGAKEIKSLSDLDKKPARKGAYKTDTYGFETGITELTAAAARYLGKRLRVNAEVVRIKKRGELFLVTYRTPDKHRRRRAPTRTLTAEAIILTTPAPVTLRIARGVLSKKQRRLMRRIEYAPYITVALFTQTPLFNRAFDLSVPGGMFFTDIYDATWVERYYNPTLRKRKQSIVTLYIPGRTYRARDLLWMSNREVLARIYPDLEKIFPGSRKRVKGYDIQRFKYAYPVLTRGAYSRIRRLNRLETEGLFLAGDYMSYPTFEAAAETGSRALTAYQEFREEPDTDIVNDEDGDDNEDDD